MKLFGFFRDGKPFCLFIGIFVENAKISLHTIESGRNLSVIFMLIENESLYVLGLSDKEKVILMVALL